MKSAVVSFLILTLASSLALANDTSIAGLTVKDIRMREYKYGNSGEEEVRRILKPFYKITFSGGDAHLLQQILPPQDTALAVNDPAFKKEYQKHFKTLAIYSPKTDVTEKILNITCESASQQFNEQGGNPTLVPKETECVIQINHIPEDQESSDWIGNMTQFTPRCEN